MKNSRTAQTLSKSLMEKDGDLKEHKNEEKMTENTPNNIVTSLAEKAFLVASPVVPKKEDGEVDHERFDHLHFCIILETAMLKVAYNLASCTDLWQC